MKREDLKGFELPDDVIDKIMELHGKSVNKTKNDLTTLQAENDTIKSQLAEANVQIESFKGMNIEQIKASADEWKTKAETAQAESTAAILKIKQDHALERELKDVFKVSDLVAVKAHLKGDGIKYNEKEDSFVGLKEQIEPLKESHGAYFADHIPPPQITMGGQSQQQRPVFTIDQIKQMNHKEINANWSAIQETLSKGK